MIQLPEDFAPATAKVVLVDFGFVQSPALGGRLARINRPGSRWRVELTWPTMPAERARVLLRRLAAAKSEGLKVPFPLMGVSQGVPGAAVVDGSGAAGTSLPLRNVTPGWLAKEGYWLTAYDSAGRGCLYQVAAPGEADATGDLVASITPMLRAPLADGDQVELGVPTIEGVIVEEIGWEYNPGQLVTGIGCVIEEAA